MNLENWYIRCLNQHFIYLSVEEDSNEDEDEDNQEDYPEQDDSIEDEEIADAGIRALMSYEVKSVVYILLFLTVVMGVHQHFKNISYFTPEDDEDEE